MAKHAAWYQHKDETHNEPQPAKREKKQTLKAFFGVAIFSHLTSVWTHQLAYQLHFPCWDWGKPPAVCS